MRNKTKKQLQILQQVMQQQNLWQAIPPDQKAFLSTEPFAMDTMEANQWLQWIFIPRMHALLESNSPLPTEIAIVPYVEEALKELEQLEDLLAPIAEIEKLCKNQ
ncbi:YqcC family protein [Seminibacterium arietis]|uniref:YqcC family protein n=1 Tax=Seminibacterium arietis TaxID=1173502 RepID=A0ABW3I7Q6_9PAST